MNGTRYPITAVLYISPPVMTAMMIELNQHHAGQDAAPAVPSPELLAAHQAIHRSTHISLWLEVHADGTFTVSLP